MKKQIIQTVGVLSVFMALVVFGVHTAYAAATPTFNQTINGGTFAVDVVDALITPVPSPAVAMTAGTFSYSCETVTGTLGTADEQVYISNPNAKAGAWTVSIAPAAHTALWENADASHTYDFNDPNATCGVDSATGTGGDGEEADTVGGKMTVTATGKTLSYGLDTSTTNDHLTLGAGTFVEKTTDSVTLVSATDEADDIGDWTLQGVAISQTVPAQQPADTYHIHMVITFI